MEESASDEWIWHGKRKRQVCAVVRIDLDWLKAEEPGEHASDGLQGVTITEVLPTPEEAAAETDRLNTLNSDKRYAYYWMTTRYYPEGRPGAGGPPSPPVPERKPEERVAELLEATVAHVTRTSANLRDAGRRPTSERSLARGVFTALRELDLITAHDYRVWARKSFEVTQPSPPPKRGVSADDWFEWVATDEVRLGGQEGTVTFHLGAGPTDQLVCREVAIGFGAFQGTVASWMHFDAELFRKELHQLLRSPYLTGEIRVASGVEAGFGVALSLAKGRGEVQVEITSEFGLQDSSLILTLTTDQSFLAETLRDLDAALRP